MARSGARQGRDGQLIAALAGGASHAEAAAAAGVSLRTVTRRTSDPAFRSELAAARRELVDRALGALAAEAAASVRVLAEVRDDPDAPPSVRRAAARDVLALLVPLAEHTAQEERLADLEARLDALTEGQR